MKITVILSDDRLVGTMLGNTEASATEVEIQTKVVPMPGQTMHEIEVPDDFARISDAAELHKKIMAYLPKES
jgi:hypothetical protein